MIIQRLNLATGLPFDLADLKTHCRVDASYFDYEVQQLGRAAAAEIEAYAQIALLTQTIRVTLDVWPCALSMPLPCAPMLDPLSVVVTADGKIFDAYTATAGLRPAIRLSDVKPSGEIVITYVAGFGSKANNIPPDLALAVLDQALASFEQRGAVDNKTNGMSAHAARIAARYRRVSL